MLTFINSSMMFYHDPMGPSPSTEPPMEVQHPSGEYCRHFTASKYCVICAQSPVTGTREGTTNGCGPIGRPQMPSDKYRPEIPQINLRAPPDAHTHPVSPHPTPHTPLPFLNPHDPQSSPPVSTPRPSEQSGIIPTSLGQMPNVSMTLQNMSCGPNTLVVPQPIMKQGGHRSIKTYHCRMCDQIFDNKSDLLVHSQHIHKADPKPYRCPTCQKCFANSSYLSQHARIHAGIKPYKCQICERRFTQLCHLQQHIRTHTGEKPYKCQHPGCGKAFSQLSNLQSHSRSHMTDKPYRCNSCYKCFSDEQGLRDHIPKHTTTKHLKTNICRICGKSYTQETYLARHMTKHQGVVDVSQATTTLSSTVSRNPNTLNQQEGGHLSLGSHGLLSPIQRSVDISQDIKPHIDSNSGSIMDTQKPSAFMPLAHQYPNPSLINSSMSSTFPFGPTTGRLQNTTLNSQLPRLSPPVSSAQYFPSFDPYLKRGDPIDRSPISMSPHDGIANSLLRLQQIKNFSTQHPVFPKCEPSSPIHKEFN